MKGWKGELFILDWSFFGWLLLVALVELVGIGLGTLFSPALGTLLGTVAAGAFSLWLNPYMNGTEANFYDWVTHGSLSYRENNGPGGYQTLRNYNQKLPRGLTPRELLVIPERRPGRRR